MHQCDAHKLCFYTTQALGGHRFSCKVAKAASSALKRIELEKSTIMDEFTTIVADEMKEKPKDTKLNVRGATLSSADFSSAAESVLDGRRSNRSRIIRKKHSNIEKVRVIENFEKTCGELTVVEWVRQTRIGREHEKHLGKSKTGWRNDHNKKKHV